MRVKPNKMITKNTKLPQINFLKKNKQTNKQKMKYFPKAERPLNICNCGLKKYYH